MAGETTITLIGNLTRDPEVRFTASGSQVANFVVASTPKTYDRSTGEWKDGETLFMSCSIWQNAAENVCNSLFKGMRVIVTGRLKQRSYDDHDGVRRTVVELDVDEVGPSLRYATAEVTKNNFNSNDSGRNSTENWSSSNSGNSANRDTTAEPWKIQQQQNEPPQF